MCIRDRCIYRYTKFKTLTFWWLLFCHAFDILPAYETSTVKAQLNTNNFINSYNFTNISIVILIIKALQFHKNNIMQKRKPNIKKYTYEHLYMFMRIYIYVIYPYTCSNWRSLVFITMNVARESPHIFPCTVLHIESRLSLIHI